MRYIFIFISFLFIFFSCKKTIKKPEFSLEKPGIYVVNEGNFTYGNASLSYINLTKDTIYNNIFYKTTTFPLGDVAQSITLFNSKIFIVINNSGKIYVIDNKTAKYIATIKGLTSPRNIQIISPDKAYISDLYSNNITIFNPTTFAKTGIIDVKCPTEAMIMLGKYVFVTNWNKGNKLLKIDTENDSLVAQIKVNQQPNSIVSDKNNNIWILSDGGQDIDTTQDEYPALTCINPTNLKIIRKLEFTDKKASPAHLCINKNKDTLYYIYSSWDGNVTNGGIYKMSITSSSLPTKAFINQNDRIFYSLAIDTKSRIIVSDAIDYVQQGTILFFSAHGQLIKTYKAGIIPGNFLFNE